MADDSAPSRTPRPPEPPPQPGPARFTAAEFERMAASDDLGHKLGFYEAAGLQEYWVVVCRERTLRRFAHDGSQFVPAKPLAYGARWDSLTLAGLSIASDGLPQG